MSAGEGSIQGNLGTLYSEHHGWLKGWLARKLGDAHQAADLAHDTFLRLLLRPREFEEGRDPRAYLTTIAKGLVVDQWRRREIERAWLEALAARPEPLAPSAEHHAIVVETLMQIDAMLDKLAEKPRRAFVMAQLHDMPYAEIARRLEVSERMVKKYMSQVMFHCLALDMEFTAATSREGR